MNSVQLVRAGLETSTRLLMMLVDDMKDQPLTFPTPNGGNHPLWVLGHLAWSDGLFLQMISGKPNPLADWASMFGAGSEPRASADAYPSFEEARAAFLARRADIGAYLETLTDDDLDRPTGQKDNVGTVGKCLMLAILNTMTHRGQVADARRAAGRSKIYV
jgi:uncharacterized damage-inducible protein DinB